MSYEISVPTPFNDVSELAESFHSRVDEERLMLPSGEQIPEGEWVTFHVTLADGSAALAGQGRCTQSFDNGEDRAPEHRFDVVMDSLQLDEMAQIYFERILQVRAAYAGDEPQTGETAVPEEAQAVAAAEEFDPADEGTAVEPSPLEEAPAEAEAAQGDDVTYDASAYDAAAAPVEGADAYASEVEADAYAEEPASEWDGEDTRAVAFEDVEGAQVEAAPEEAAPAEEYAEAAPAEEYAEAAPEEYAEAAPAEEYAEVPVDADELPSEELDSGLIEEPPSQEVAPAPDPTLTAPAETRIYDLPDPQAPGALPSPHSVEAVLTRRLLHATWSPTPGERAMPAASTGYFDYAQGAGLPQPPSPPRPDIDPSMRVAPAPQPGDAYQAPVAQAAAPEAEYAEQAEYAEGGEYAEQAEYAEGGEQAEYAEGGEYAEAAYEEAPAEGEYAEAAAEGEYAAEGYEEPQVEGEAAYEEAAEGEYAAEGYEEPQVEGEYAEAAYEEAAEGGYEAAVEVEGEAPEGYDAEAYDPNAEGETRQVDVSGLPDDIPLGDETLQVEIPED